MRAITISLRGHTGDEYRRALRSLADAAFDDNEAGKGGAKLSKMFQVMAMAYLEHPEVTVAAMHAIKAAARTD